MSDELVKRLREKAGAFDYDGRPDIACDYEQATDAIEELQSRAKVLEKVADKWCEAVPKWIPVSEKLPEKGYYVLAYEDDDIMMASYTDGNWVLRDIYEIIDDLKPTHWMPLPQPPKEET